MLIEQMNRLERMEYENRLENGITETEGNGMQPPNAHCHETNTSEREVSNYELRVPFPILYFRFGNIT